MSLRHLIEYEGFTDCWFYNLIAVPHAVPRIPPHSRTFPPVNTHVSDTGFVYVATGERYVCEAAASAATLRAHHPHTRAVDGLGELARRLNVRLGRRAYVPTLDAIAMDDQEGAESRRLAFATIKSVMRGFARKLLPRAWRDWLRAHHLFADWRQIKRHESAAIGDETKWKTNR